MSGHSRLQFSIVDFSQLTISSVYVSTNPEPRFASIEGQCPSKSDVLEATHEARLRALKYCPDKGFCLSNKFMLVFNK